MTQQADTCIVLKTLKPSDKSLQYVNRITSHNRPTLEVVTVPIALQQILIHHYASFYSPRRRNFPYTILALSAIHGVSTMYSTLANYMYASSRTETTSETLSKLSGARDPTG